MSSQNYLHRGGEKILIEKEPEFFTTIIPDQKALEKLASLVPVEEVKQVFSNMYKVRAVEGARDEVMNQLRSDERTPGICHHAYHPVDDEATRYYITDLLVVAFKSEVSNNAIEKILASHGLRFIKTFGTEESHIYLLQVTKSAGKNPVKVSEDLMERPEILYAEPNLVNRFESFYTPQDDLFRYQWHLRSTRGVELIPEANIEANNAWDITRGNRNIVVAVIDDGFDITHPDLSGIGKLVFPKDFADSDNEPLPNFARGDFHGTPCAGLAIGEENGNGVIGVAPGCAFMPVRFGMTADDKLLHEIFEYVGKRADVISNSWGPVPVYAPLSSLLRDQMTELVKSGGPRGKGCVILFAAGNYNAPLNERNIDRFVWRHPSSGLKETRGTILNGYSANPDVITVSASTSQNLKAAYSNWGKEIDICAPSDNVHPIDAQIRLPGQSIWTIDNARFGKRYTDKFGGTSASCPMVAGVAALVLSVNPELTAEQVRQILLSTADKIIDENPDVVLNLRKGVYDEKGHSEWFGFGKVNAYKAVLRALELKENEGEESPQIEPQALLTEGIHIAAAMVNPAGGDRGKEMVSIFNSTDQPVDLRGWVIRNKRGETERISNLIINPGATGIVNLQQVRLPNLGGSIELLNPNGFRVDEVNYNFIQGLKAGWWIKF
ncbi:MAG: S8 family serine peptidase [Saprospiraceae bacterium]|nr:S8 family serine peptidase [Saprospiraceae bacterium]